MFALERQKALEGTRRIHGGSMQESAAPCGSIGIIGIIGGTMRQQQAAAGSTSNSYTSAKMV